MSDNAESSASGPPANSSGMREQREIEEIERPSTPLPKILLFVAVIAAVLVLLMYGASGPPIRDGRRHPAVGKPLKALRLDPLTGSGEPVDLKSLAGKVVLINYWGTWCYPCRIEFPHIVDMHRRYGARGDFQLLSVSCLPAGGGTEEQLRAETKEYLRRFGAVFEAYSDLRLISRRALVESANMNDLSYPTTVIIDQQGRIQGIWGGYSGGMELELIDVIEELLARASG